jgi:putative ABC transport system permease protein
MRAALVREPDAPRAASASARAASCDRGRRGLGASGPGTLFDTKYRLPARGHRPRRAARRGARRFSPIPACAGATRATARRAWRRFVDRLGAFLVLVGLAGLAVGGVGVSAAVRAYLEGKTAVIATLKTLGAEGRTIFAVYFPDRALSLSASRSAWCWAPGAAALAR